MTTSSTQSGASASHRCPVCTVVGLPVMPVRYAVAWSGDDVPDTERAPDLVETFSATAYPVLGTNKASYTLRRLRGGYLYVYDEAHNEWSAYEVDEAAQLHRFDIDDGPLAGESPAMPAMCSRTAPLSLARCIQIRNADRATRVWMAFSDTRWTAAVKKEHEASDYRARHMRCVDVSAWVKSKGESSQSHTSKLVDAIERVSEYVVCQDVPVFQDSTQRAGNLVTAGTPTLASIRVVVHPAFQFSPYSVGKGSRREFTGVLWGNHPDDPAPVDPPPMMVALDDPVGVTSELAALMDWRLEEFMHESDRIRPLAASAAIQKLRGDVEHQAQLQAIEDVEFYNVTHTDPYVAQRTGTVAGQQLELTPEDLIGVRANAWETGRYLEKYDESGRSNWQRQHEAELQALDRHVIKPLADAHVALLKGSTLQVHLQCNYDPEDMQSGAGYLGAVLSCIAGTADKQPQAALYQEWFESSPCQRDNLLLRAFALNQERIAEQLAQAAESTTDLKLATLPWDKLFALYNEAGKHVGSDSLNAFMAVLVKQTLGPAGKVISKVVDSAPKLYGLAAWGMASNQPLHWVPVSGTSDEIVRGVMVAFQRELGFRQGSSTVRSELRRLQIYGVNRFQRINTGFVGLRRDGTLTTRETLNARRSDFLNGKLVNWRSAMDTSVRTGVGASLLTSLALFQLYKDATTGMRHQRMESWTRFGVAATGTVAAAVEASGIALESFAEISPRYAKHVRLWRYMRIGGKVAGVLASVFTAIFDFLRFVSEYREKNFAVAGAYLISGVAGTVLAFALLASAVLVAVIAFIVLMLASVFILWRSDTAGHDWLERCLWGRLQDQKYPNNLVEIEEYQAAMRAM